MRLLPTLLLVVFSALGGALLAMALREPDASESDVQLARQAERIEALQLEVRRLQSEAEPALAGHPRSVASGGDESTPREAPEAPAPERGPAETEAEADYAAVPVVPPPLSMKAGGALDVVRTFLASDARQTDTALVGDPEAMATLFERVAEGPTVRAAETPPDSGLVDGTTVVLDAGVYDFRAFSGAHRGTFPADVTFRGVDMDRTLLILHEVSSTGEARNLGFEDLTLDTRGHYLADVRGDEPISLRFERTRVIGWDQKPGGAVLLAARHGAIFARDSRFEAGFGNALGAGAFFHVRGPFLVRFERCTFVGPFQRLYEPSEKASYAWVGCRFEGLGEARRREVENPAPNLRFENCSFTYRAAGEEPAARSRAELNPAWR